MSGLKSTPQFLSAGGLIQCHASQHRLHARSSALPSAQTPPPLTGPEATCPQASYWAQPPPSCLSFHERLKSQTPAASASSSFPTATVRKSHPPQLQIHPPGITTHTPTSVHVLITPKRQLQWPPSWCPGHPVALQPTLTHSQPPRCAAVPRPSTFLQTCQHLAPGPLHILSLAPSPCPCPLL